jgi:hypothetical protein
VIGNPIKQNDRDFLETILDLPIAAIRGGIAKSLLLCQTRINSLRYCAGAIEELFQARDEILPTAFGLEMTARYNSRFSIR